ncbi:MAG: hypothetical protein JWO03_2881 [Bacteroidetes bacterium]|nr:hypothetical protein [Bacteroidota bacterium]
MIHYITIADVLQLLRIGHRCTIVVCSYDKNRETGGDRVTYKDVILRSATVKGEARPASSPVAGPSSNTSKNPHHRFNKTVNIQTKNGDIVTIHPVLIEEFNGQRVTL